jgi:hypothetical protein
MPSLTDEDKYFFIGPNENFLEDYQDRRDGSTEEVSMFWGPLAMMIKNGFQHRLTESEYQRTRG